MKASPKSAQIGLVITKKNQMNSYTKTDEILHCLCQVIAKANRTYVNPVDDDSHTNLYFDPVNSRILGRWIQAGDQKVIIALNLDKLSFEFLDDNLNIIKEVLIISRTIHSIEKEIEELLPSIGLNPDGFTTELHFEIPKYAFANDPIQELHAKELANWKEFREIANETCFALLGIAQSHEEVRIWPHHFDTGIYFKAKDNLGVGFGWAMQDKMAGAPYFYMSVYPEEGAVTYEELPEGAWKWEVGEHWKGAILTMDVMVKLAPTQRKHMLQNYISTVYKWMIEQ